MLVVALAKNTFRTPFALSRFICRWELWRCAKSWRSIWQRAFHETASQQDRELVIYHLRRLRQLQYYVDQGVMMRLVMSLVVSCLDYCNAVFASSPESTVAPLQHVHRRPTHTWSLPSISHQTGITATSRTGCQYIFNEIAALMSCVLHRCCPQSPTGIHHIQRRTWLVDVAWTRQPLDLPRFIVHNFQSVAPPFGTVYLRHCLTDDYLQFHGGTSAFI